MTADALSMRGEVLDSKLRSLFSTPSFNYIFFYGRSESHFHLRWVSSGLFLRLPRLLSHFSGRIRTKLPSVLFAFAQFFEF